QELLLKMADECVKVLHTAIDAYVRLDHKTAEEVLRMDDSVDQYFAMVKEAIIQEVARAETPKISFDVILMAKYLERIGDHCCNIAKWVLYIITGKQPGER
ncbi:MAG: PhoU domain-containing protein, partial [Succinatimonas hippei]|nr:PhoU domain-containing protein [Succinatimonas hippei]